MYDIESEADDHSRAIIHIDIDCFYAQVEMIKDPRLCQVPLGVKQKNILVTSNYIARKHGIKKCMLISDALTICPNLEIVNGEDLYDYRKTSYQVTSYLQKYSALVERLGLDENYVDITQLVNERLKHQGENVHAKGNLFNNDNATCLCGCTERIKMASLIAQEIRDGILLELKLTTCAGISYNKLLAKLACSLHKPNQQTTVLPNHAVPLILSLNNVSEIPGVGSATNEVLEKINIRTVEDLQKCYFETLVQALNADKAKWLIDLSYGRDNSVVKTSGRPQSIGLEDSCKVLNVETEVRDKFHQLLMRLIILVSEDGRVPTTIKVTIRKFDGASRVSHRETKQCNISPGLFSTDKVTHMVSLNEPSEKKLLSIIMSLFKKLVNTSHSYHITLLGLSFTKFKERIGGKNSIASYFVNDLAVQSVTSIERKNSISQPRTSLQTATSTGGVEIEIEPQPKKSRLGSLSTRNARLSESDYSSPSKLRVAELRLNSRDSDNSDSVSSNQDIECPPNADQDVFKELPSDVQRELWEDWKRSRSHDESSDKPFKKARTNTLLNYFLKN
ncbi:hypothetical protein PPYR_01359 [Photinus pyralis]|uniref:UmuC domain-containing protein n=1 Tax=Photinus pyralis TaxID=7054 RepID=A0A5N4B441_PHOPY|nr:DNA polymerase iota-like [Photinus pyralis]KAB0804389.1 hypothetical protein PPYR_01359 [Photinus pyralis]